VLVIDLDATIVIAHSEKENAAATFSLDPPRRFLGCAERAG